MRPLIGITSGTSALDEHAKAAQDRLNRSYCEAVALGGGIPVILPNLVVGADSEEIIARIDGVLLSGGYDVDPAEFGEKRFNETVEVDAERDAAELPLIHAALRRDAPIFAICRGIQSLNVALGGTLIQDLPAQAPSAIRHRQDEKREVATHSVCVEPGSRLSEAIGTETLCVNSFHHQAVKDLGKGLVVTARAEDGVIEALEMPGLRYVVAVQFHPEEMVRTSAEARRLFEAFVAAAGRQT